MKLISKFAKQSKMKNVFIGWIAESGDSTKKEDKVSETNNKHSKIKIPNITTIDYNHTLINTKTQIYEDSYR